MISKGYVNKVMLVGRLGKTPELHHTQKGTPVSTLSIATNRDIKTVEGADKEEVTWHRATVWGKTAENCAKFLTTGSRVFVEGDLRSRTWTDKDGIERRTAEISVYKVDFLGGDKPSGIKATSDETLTTAVALAL